MTRPLLKTALFISAAALCSCLEPQPAPELTERPISDFTLTSLASGLNTPWSAAPLPYGGYLVTEKAGALKHVLVSGAIRDIPGLPVDIYTEQQAGLFDVVIAPDFEISQKLYLSYAYGNDKANGTALVSAIYDGESLSDLSVLFKSSPDKDTASHFGGRIVVMPGGTLMLTLGDGFVYREAAQDKGTHLGKIVHLNPNGTPAAGNPFVGDADAKPEIYSYGHRNIQGAYFDLATGNFWAHEHGPRGGDELNLIKPGSNYGWPLATTGTDYTGAKITPFKTLSDTTPFVHQWTPSIAPSGLVIYRGDMFPNWNGDALVGGLASKSLRRVDLENGISVGEEVLLSDINARVRDVRTDLDGAVLLVINRSRDTDEGGGEILRLTP